MHYYNEIDPFAVEWLKVLISEGHLPKGVVDDRPIEQVPPSDIAGFTQCHFFAGIGGWPLALKLAGWPESRPCWTGSAPCQPHSIAGKNIGFDDPRHIWWAWHWHIGQLRPATIFGEQVAGPAGLRWFDLVSDNLEAFDYAIGAAVIAAASVAAPHERKRLVFVAHAHNEGLQGRLHRGPHQGREMEQRHIGRGSTAGGFSNTAGNRQRQGWRYLAQGAEQPQSDSFLVHTGSRHSPWRNLDWIYGKDGKWRPLEPELIPLVDGIPSRMGQLRGYGNAIVPQAIAPFIKTVMEMI